MTRPLPLVRLDPASDGATVGIRRDAGVLPVRHVVGVGRNYAAHAQEQRARVPERPMLFTKNPASCCLDGDDVVIPPICADPDTGGDQVDYEGEVAVVVGAPLRDATPEAIAAGAGILGVCCANDVSARWWQRHGSGGQFCRGKGFDTFCPLGPAVVPWAALDDPADLRLRTLLNGEVVQSDSTASMCFPIPVLLAEICRGTTLVPGTVVLTGTPAGVGAAREPQRFLRPGDVVEVEIEGVGRLRNGVRAG